MSKKITFDLGHNIGLHDIAVGSIVFIDQAMPILIRSIKLWKLNNVPIKNCINENPLSALLKLNNLEETENPDVVIYESDDVPIFNKDSINIVLQTQSNFDYRITLNGIYNSKDELIKEYTFLTENDKMFCKYSGLNAFEGFFGFNIRFGVAGTCITNYNGYNKPIVENYMINQLKPDSSKLILHIGSVNIHNLNEVMFGSPVFHSDTELDLYLKFIWNDCISLWDNMGFRYRRPFFDNVKSLTNTHNEILNFLNEFVKDKKIRNEIIQMITAIKYPNNIFETQAFMSKEKIGELNPLEVALLGSIFFYKIKVYCFIEIDESDTNIEYYRNLELLMNSFGTKISRKKIYIANMRFDNFEIRNNPLLLKDGQSLGSFLIKPQENDFSSTNQKVHNLSIREDNSFVFNVKNNSYKNKGFIFDDNNKNSYYYKMNKIIEFIKEEDLDNLLDSKDILITSDCYSWSVLHLLLNYAQSFDFLRKAFDAIVGRYPQLYIKDRNYLIFFIEQNNNFNDSDLVLFVDYFLLNYKRDYNEFAGSPYYILDRIKFLYSNELIESEWFLSLYTKNFPIKLLDCLPSWVKADLIWNNKRMSHYYHVLNSTNLDFITNNIFKHNGKRIKRYYLDNLARNPFLLLDKMTYVAAIFDNYDLKLRALSEITKSIDSSEELLKDFNMFVSNILLRNRKENFLFFINNLSNSKRNKFFINNICDIGLMKDTIALYSEYYEKTNMVFNSTDFDSIRDLHDELAKVVRLIKIPNEIFDNKDISLLDNCTFLYNGSQYEIKIPKNSHDVLSLGSEMDICIGSNSYIKTHLNKTHFILKLYKNKKLYAAVHCIYKDSKIDQIKKHRNQNLDLEEIAVIQSVIINKK
jgi:hypothetical protein